MPEKQISVGSGALAALAAYRYLVEGGLVARRSVLEDEWG